MDALALAVLDGTSKAHVMRNQDAVADLFVEGIDDRRSGTGNLQSEDGILWHYSTVEAVRTRAGAIIRNSQCWSAGFAVCPWLRGTSEHWEAREDFKLPLTTLQGIAQNMNGYSTHLRGIEILDTLKGSTLFTFKDRFFLFGHDEVDFLAEVPGEPENVEEAFYTLTPEAAKAAQQRGLKARRQGDLFFIPAAESFELAKAFFSGGKVPSQRAHFEEVPAAIWAHLKGHEKRLVRPAILETNHTARELVELVNGPTYVRGDIRHGSIRTFNRQHATIQLGDEWHEALQNLALNSWNLERQGGGGFD